MAAHGQTSTVTRTITFLFFVVLKKKIKIKDIKRSTRSFWVYYFNETIYTYAIKMYWRFIEFTISNDCTYFNITQI